MNSVENLAWIGLICEKKEGLILEKLEDLVEMRNWIDDRELLKLSKNLKGF
jgi:hypothetical protein